MAHIMIDIETVGRRNDAAIREVGLVAFNYDGVILASCQLTVSPSCWNSAKRTFTGETILWMNEHSRINIDANCPNYPTLISSVDKFFSENLTEDSRVWSKGHMDLEVLKDLYEYFERPLPYAFWQPRDLRTLLDFFDSFNDSHPQHSHRAMDDAMHQVHILCNLIKINSLGRLNRTQ